MKYLISLLALCLCLGACAHKQHNDDVFAPFYLELEGFYAKTSNNAASTASQNISQKPLLTSSGVVLLGSNMILKFGVLNNQNIALYFSLANPQNAMENLVSKTASRVNAAAINKDGSMELLKFSSGTNGWEEGSKLFIAPYNLEPGQHKAGVIFFENKKAPRYKLTIINETETIELTFKGQPNK